MKWACPLFWPALQPSDLFPIHLTPFCGHVQDKCIDVVELQAWFAKGWKAMHAFVDGSKQERPDIEPETKPDTKTDTKTDTQTKTGTKTETKTDSFGRASMAADLHVMTSPHHLSSPKSPALFERRERDTRGQLQPQPNKAVVPVFVLKELEKNARMLRKGAVQASTEATRTQERADRLKAAAQAAHRVAHRGSHPSSPNAPLCAECMACWRLLQAFQAMRKSTTYSTS